MKKSIQFILVLMFLFVFTLGVNVQAATNEQAKITTLNISVKYGQTEARKMLDMINQFRTGKDAWYYTDDSKKNKEFCSGLNKLTYDYNLEKIAMQRAAEIALNFDHTRPNGKTCYTVTANNCTSSGENIAAGYNMYTTAKDVFVGWQETNYGVSGQGHRRNMLGRNYTAIGIGHVYYNGSHYWVQEFGFSNSNSTKTIANDKNTTVPVEILEQNIKGTLVKPSISSIKLAKNEKISLPKVTTYATIYEAWPSSNCPVVESYTWKVENTAYAKISSGKLVGVKSGKTNLVTYVKGKKVSIPITVGYEPEKVTGLKASSQTTTSLKLSWKKTSDTTGYKIYRYDSKTKKYKKIATTKGTSYTVKKLKAGTSYKFKVVAYKTVKKKEYVGSYSSVLTTATKPTTPGISKLTTKSKKATVQWKKISGASGYEICMATSKKGKYTKVATVEKGSTVKYTKKSLKKNKKYYFKVRAYKTVNGKKIYSSYSCAKMVKVK